MNNLSYYEKLQELLNKQGTTVEFCSLYKNHFGKEPTKELKDQYQLRLQEGVEDNVDNLEDNSNDDESYEESYEESYDPEPEEEEEEIKPEDNVILNPGLIDFEIMKELDRLVEQIESPSIAGDEIERLDKLIDELDQ